MTFRFSFFFLLSLCFWNLSAQDYQIKPGQLQVQASVGLVPTLAADATATLVPPVTLNAEVFLSPNFALGLSGSYSRYSGEYINQNAGIVEQYETTTTMIGLRTAVHSNDLNNWRVYGGFTIGASIPNVEKEVIALPGEQTRDDELPTFSRPQSSSLLFSGFVGTRRTLNARLSVFGELGFGISLVNVGAGYKF